MCWALTCGRPVWRCQAGLPAPLVTRLVAGWATGLRHAEWLRPAVCAVPSLAVYGWLGCEVGQPFPAQSCALGTKTEKPVCNWEVGASVGTLHRVAPLSWQNLIRSSLRMLTALCHPCHDTRGCTDFPYSAARHAPEICVVWPSLGTKILHLQACWQGSDCFTYPAAVHSATCCCLPSSLCSSRGCG